VGFDDNRELNLEGARSALPIWAEFMKRAAKMRPYRGVKMFSPPPGVLTASVCADPQLDADASHSKRTEVFISGTEPTAPCDVSAAPLQGSADRVVDPVSGTATGH
jgi:penicillin-binding protein 1B